MIHLALTVAAFLFLVVVGWWALVFGFGIVVVIIRAANAATRAMGDEVIRIASESTSAFRRQPKWIRLWVYALLLGFACWGIAMVFAFRR